MLYSLFILCFIHYLHYIIIIIYIIIRLIILNHDFVLEMPSVQFLPKATPLERSEDFSQYIFAASS